MAKAPRRAVRAPRADGRRRFVAVGARGLIWAAVVWACLAGCAEVPIRYRVIPLSALRAPPAVRPPWVQVTLTDGSRVVLSRPRIEGEDIAGRVVECEGDGCGIARRYGRVGMPSVATIAVLRDDLGSGSAEPVPDVRTGPRPWLRFAFGGAGLVTFDRTNVGGGVGVYARVGFEPHEHFGVELEVDGATILLLGGVRGALLLAWSPTRWLTVASGASAQWAYWARGWFGSGGGGDLIDSISVGVPLRVRFHVGRWDRHGVRVGGEIVLGGNLGLTVGRREPDIAGSAHVGFGYLLP